MKKGSSKQNKKTESRLSKDLYPKWGTIFKHHIKYLQSKIIKEYPKKYGLKNSSQLTKFQPLIQFKIQYGRIPLLPQYIQQTQMLTQKNIVKCLIFNQNEDRFRQSQVQKLKKELNTKEGQAQKIKNSEIIKKIQKKDKNKKDKKDTKTKKIKKEKLPKFNVKYQTYRNDILKSCNYNPVEALEVIKNQKIIFSKRIIQNINGHFKNSFIKQFPIIQQKLRTIKTQQLFDKIRNSIIQVQEPKRTHPLELSLKKKRSIKRKNPIKKNKDNLQMAQNEDTKIQSLTYYNSRNENIKKNTTKYKASTCSTSQKYKNDLNEIQIPLVNEDEPRESWSNEKLSLDLFSFEMSRNNTVQQIREEQNIISLHFKSQCQIFLKEPQDSYIQQEQLPKIFRTKISNQINDYFDFDKLNTK